MGRKFIIKGADFSENAVSREMPPIDITALLQENYKQGWHGLNNTSATSANGVSPRIDLTSYINGGYTNIKCVVKKQDGVLPILAKIATGIVTQSTSAANGYVALDPSVGTGYMSEGTYNYSLSDAISSGLVYLGGQFNKSKAGDYSDISNYIEVTLT